MEDEIKLVSAGVLAGAYKGADLSERTLLRHAVSESAVTVGRIKREAGEALCNRKLDTAGDYSPVTEVTCPKCREIMARGSKPTDAQRERQAHRSGGQYAKVNPCECCGKSAGVDYYSAEDANTTGVGLVLCAKCADGWDSDPETYRAKAEARRAAQ